MLRLVCLWLCACLPVYAGDLIIGDSDPHESLIISQDTSVSGNVVLVNAGQLFITNGATLTLSGDVLCADTSYLGIANGTIHLLQQYAYHMGFQLTQDAVFAGELATLNGNGYSFSMAVLNAGTVTYEQVAMVDGFATWVLFDTACATLAGCSNTGEFVLFGNGDLDIQDSHTVLIWVTLFSGSFINTSLPAPGTVADFLLDDQTPWAGNIPYSVHLRDCTDVMWAIMARSGSSATLVDTELRAVGSFFEHDNSITIQGIANQCLLHDTVLQWGDIQYAFDNVSVHSWNFYAYGTTSLTLESCLFGELLAEENGEAWVVQSMCDGSGGYMGAFYNGKIVMVLSSNLGQTTCGHNGLIIAQNSSLLNPRIDATGTALMVFLNSQCAGEPRAREGAAVFDALVSSLTATTGRSVAVSGTARMLHGPECALVYNGYELDYGFGPEPASWQNIANGSAEPVFYGLLGTWQTLGLDAGAYTLRLSLLSSLGDPICSFSQAVLAPPANPADLNGDGWVDVTDLGILLSAYHVSSWGDVDGDGVTGPLDLAQLLASMD